MAKRKSKKTKVEKGTASVWTASDDSQDGRVAANMEAVDLPAGQAEGHDTPAAFEAEVALIADLKKINKVIRQRKAACSFLADKLKAAKANLAEAQDQKDQIVDALAGEAEMPLFSDGGAGGKTEPTQAPVDEETDPPEAAEVGDGEPDCDEPADAWRDELLSGLVDPATGQQEIAPKFLKALADCEPPITTVGQLEDLRAKGDWWTDRVDGLGAAGREQIENAIVNFWQRQTAEAASR